MRINSVDRIIEKYSSLKKEQFTDYVEMLFYQFNVTSPIEKTFLYSILALSEIELLSSETIVFEKKPSTIGLRVIAQVPIGDYRVDFLCEFRTDPSDEFKQVIVECDSQEFHDRSEKERRYEKKRDRFLQKEGYKVFRFTGSEILKEPFRCASEVVEFLSGMKVGEEFLNG